MPECRDVALSLCRSTLLVTAGLVPAAHHLSRVKACPDGVLDARDGAVSPCRCVAQPLSASGCTSGWASWNAGCCCARASTAEISGQASTSTLNRRAE